MSEEIDRGFKKDNVKKLFKWEGTKEIMWILFILLMLFIGWAYNSETKSCRSMQTTDCFKQCSFKEAVEKIRLENPTLSFQCNNNTLTCDFSGVEEGGLKKFIEGDTITNTSTNNSLSDTRQT
jgi:Zn/Cd-binding protein ZinT